MPEEGGGVCRGDRPEWGVWTCDMVVEVLGEAAWSRRTGQRGGLGKNVDLMV